MELIFKIVREFILDRSKSIGQRAGLTILIIIILFSVDRILNFTYDIHINNKLNAIEKITNLKKEYKNDSLYTIQLSKLETEYKERKHYSDYYNSYKSRFLNFSKSLFRSDNKEITKNQIKNDNTITNSPIRSGFWMFVSSNLFFILLCIFILIMLLISKDVRSKDSFLGLIVIFIVVVAIMSFATWTAYLIPLIHNNPIFNYILNFIIHITIIILVINGIVKSTKKKTPNR